MHRRRQNVVRAVILLPVARHNCCKTSITYLVVLFVRVDVVEKEESIFGFILDWKNFSCRLLYHVEFVL